MDPWVCNRTLVAISSSRDFLIKTLERFPQTEVSLTGTEGGNFLNETTECVISSNQLRLLFIDSRVASLCFVPSSLLFSSAESNVRSFNHSQSFKHSGSCLTFQSFICLALTRVTSPS